MAGLAIHLDGITKSFGGQAVLRAIDLSVEAGELVSLLGPSGCGKSTLLRIIAGLENADTGSIRLGEARVDTLPAGSRDLAMVFQSYALYPHMSVADNIGLSLEMTELSRMQRLPLLGPVVPGTRTLRREIGERVARTAELVEIGHLLKRRPGQLSGGQRQRVALARAMAREPRIFLMDEPLSNLDAKLRVAMREEIVALKKRLGATFLFVTHDQSDAIAMSDRIVLMMGGRIRQIAKPQDIYDAPAHVDVATFIGYPAINLFPVVIHPGGRITSDDARLNLAAHATATPEGQLGVRAEALAPSLSPVTDAVICVPVRLERIEQMGAESLLRCRTSRTGRVVTCRLSAARLEALRAEGVLAHEFHLCASGRGVHFFAEDGMAFPLHLPVPVERTRETML